MYSYYLILRNQFLMLKNTYLLAITFGYDYTDIFVYEILVSPQRIYGKERNRDISHFGVPPSKIMIVEVQ